MAFRKVILTIEKIVKEDSESRAIELARSDLCESDFYYMQNWHSYELSDADIEAEHNKQLSVIAEQ